VSQNADILNTAVLTGRSVKAPLQVLAVEADGSVTDVTNSTSCRSTEEDVLQICEGCDCALVSGAESRGRTSVMLNFTYGFLKAQLEMSVWVPRLPLRMDVADPELSQIKGWRVPVATGGRRTPDSLVLDRGPAGAGGLLKLPARGQRLIWDSEEEDEMRKGRGCMLHYQSSPLRVLTPFIAQADGGASIAYFLGPDWQLNRFENDEKAHWAGRLLLGWQVDVTHLVGSALKVVDPDVLLVRDEGVLQGRAAGTTAVQVLSPLTSAVLAQTTIRVLDDRVSVTQLGVTLVSGLSLSLQLSPGSSRAIIATTTMRQTITQPKQEALVSCWLRFSDGAVAPLDLFDRGSYTLTVSTPDESLATVRRTPQSTFVVAQGGGEGQEALVKVELRICEECQKSKRRSKLAVGVGLLQIRPQSSSSSAVGAGGDGRKSGGRRSSELIGELQTWSQLTVTAAGQQDSALPAASTSSTSASPSVEPEVAGTTSGLQDGSGPESSATEPSAQTHTQEPRGEAQTDAPGARPPRVLEGDLSRAFGALWELEVGVYALAGVCCLALVALLLRCSSRSLCAPAQKSPVQPGLAAGPEPHKHDWRRGARWTPSAATRHPRGRPRWVATAAAPSSISTARAAGPCSTAPPPCWPGLSGANRSTRPPASGTRSSSPPSPRWTSSICPP
ncbi:unnamed protein product, partial [Tetraodon nigroviridis]